MITTKLIQEIELDKYLNGERDLASKAKALLAQQKEVWDLCANGYRSLDSIQVRKFEFDGFYVKVQFNPGRITSSAAKVDEKSIKERKCFLCYNHLPEAQKGILYRENYLLLCNPFPIFNEHFTVPHVEHIPQSIEESFDKMLEIAKDLGRYYTVFYNGPKCGASAPDHLHFQAGNKSFMPIDAEYQALTDSFGEVLLENEEIKIVAVEKYLSKFFALESNNEGALVNAFDNFINSFAKVSSPSEEPMMNVLVSYQDEKWRVMVFPRAKHRPSCFFAEGDENILISPASVDMGGVLITPLEKDFDKITKDDVINIFKEVTLSTEFFEFLKSSFVKSAAGTESKE